MEEAAINRANRSKEINTVHPGAPEGNQNAKQPGGQLRRKNEIAMCLVCEREFCDGNCDKIRRCKN